MAASEEPFDPAAEKLNQDDLSLEDRIENPVISNILCMVEKCQKSTSDEQLTCLVSIWNEVFLNASHLPRIEQFFLSLFKETCKVVLSEQWRTVKLTYRHQLAYAVSRCGEKLNNGIEQAQKLSNALVIAIFTPWSDDAFSYDFLKNEPIELVLARVEFLLSKGNEDDAMLLCENYFRLNEQKSTDAQASGSSGAGGSKEGQNDKTVRSLSVLEESEIIPLLERFVLMLFRKNRIMDIVTATLQCSCHQGVRLVRSIQNSKFPESSALAQVLTHIFLVQDLHFPSTYCCTKELMGLWCWLQAHQSTSFHSVAKAAKKLIVQHASNSAHFYLFVDMLWEQFGYHLLPLYLELYVLGLTTDINHLEFVRHNDSPLLAVELETHIAGVFAKLSSLFNNSQDVLARECLLSAFSLEPTPERLLQLDELYQAVEQKLCKASSNEEECKAPEPKPNDLNTEGLAFMIQERVQQCNEEETPEQKEVERPNQCRCEGRCSTPTRDTATQNLFIFNHPVLDQEFPGLSTNLLKDLVTVAEGIRNVMMRNPSTWSVLRPICEAHLEVVSALHVMMKYNQPVDDSADSETDSKTEEESVHSAGRTRSMPSRASSFGMHSDEESVHRELLAHNTAINKERHKMIRYLTSTGLGSKKKRKKKKRRAHKDKEKRPHPDGHGVKKNGKKMKRQEKTDQRMHFEKATENERAEARLSAVGGLMNDNLLRLTAEESNIGIGPSSPGNVSQGSLRPINEIQTTVQATVALKKDKVLPTPKVIQKISSKSLVKMKSKSKVETKNHKHLNKKRKKILKSLSVKRRSRVDAQCQTDVTLSSSALVGPNLSVITPVPSFVALKGPKIPETDYGLNFPPSVKNLPSRKEFVPVIKGTVSSFTNTITETQAPRSRVYKNPVYYPVDCKFSLPNDTPTSSSQTSSTYTSSISSTVKTLNVAPTKNNVNAPSTATEPTVTVQKPSSSVQRPNANQKVVFKQIITPGQAAGTGVALQFTTPTSQTVQIPVSNGLQNVRSQKIINNLVLPSGNLNSSGVQPVLANRIVIQKPNTQSLTVPGLIVVQPQNLINKNTHTLVHKNVKPKTDFVKRKSWTHIQSHPGKFVYQKTANHEPAYVTVARCAMPTSVGYCIGSTNSSSTLTMARPLPANATIQTVSSNVNSTIKTNDIAIKLETTGGSSVVLDSTKISGDRSKLQKIIKNQLVLENPVCVVGTKKLFKTHKKIIANVIKPEESAKIMPSVVERHKSTDPGSTYQAFSGEWGKSNIGELALCTTVITPNPASVNQQTVPSVDSTLLIDQKPIRLGQAIVPGGFVVSNSILPPICDVNSEENMVPLYTTTKSDENLLPVNAIKTEPTSVPVFIAKTEPTSMPVFIAKTEKPLTVSSSTDHLLKPAVVKKGVPNQKKDLKIKKDPVPIKAKTPVAAKPKEKKNKSKLLPKLLTGLQSMGIKTSAVVKKENVTSLDLTKIVDSSTLLSSCVSSTSAFLASHIQSPITTCNTVVTTSITSTVCSSTVSCSTTTSVSSLCSTPVVTSSQKQSDTVSKTVMSTAKPALSQSSTPSSAVASLSKCPVKKKNSVVTTEEVMDMIESITTATAKLEMERGKKAVVKTVFSQSTENVVPKKKKKKSSSDHDGCPTSPRDNNHMAKVVCDDCGRGLATTYNLRRHMKNVHNKILPLLSNQISSTSNQIEPFGSAPFDHTIPQLHIADDEEQFPLLDEAFLNPPLLSPPRTASLEKLSDCVSLAQSNGSVLLNSTTINNLPTTLPGNESLGCTDSVMSVSNTSLVSNSEDQPSKFINEPYMFEDLCSDVGQTTSASEQNTTKDNPLLQSSIFDNQCDNTTVQFLKDENIYKQDPEKQAAIVKIEPQEDCNEQPQLPEPSVAESQSNDIISLDQWIKPVMSDMDIFGSKPDLVYDLLDNDIKPDLASLPPNCPDESYKYTADLSKFEAINENSNQPKIHSSKHKVKGSKNIVDVKIVKQEFVDTGTPCTPTILDELFENESGVDLPKCKSSKHALVSASSQQVENISFIQEFQNSLSNSVPLDADLYDSKENASLFPIDSTNALFHTQTVAATDGIPLDDSKMEAENSVINLEDIAAAQILADAFAVRKLEDTSPVQKFENTSTGQKYDCTSTVQKFEDSSFLQKLEYISTPTLDDISAAQNLEDTSFAQKMEDVSNAEKTVLASYEPNQDGTFSAQQLNDNSDVQLEDTSTQQKLEDTATQQILEDTSTQQKLEHTYAAQTLEDTSLHKLEYPENSCAQNLEDTSGQNKDDTVVQALGDVHQEKDIYDSTKSNVTLNIKSEPLDEQVTYLESGVSALSDENLEKTIVTKVESVEVPQLVIKCESNDPSSSVSCATDSQSQSSENTSCRPPPKSLDRSEDLISKEQGNCAQFNTGTLEQETSAEVAKLMGEIVHSLSNIEPVKKSTTQTLEHKVVKSDSRQSTGHTSKLTKVYEKKMIRCKSAPGIWLNELQVVLTKCKDPEIELLRQSKHHHPAPQSHNVSRLSTLHSDRASELNRNVTSNESATRTNVTESKVLSSNKSQTKASVPSSNVHVNKVPLVQSTENTATEKLVLQRLIDQVVKRERVGVQARNTNRKRTFSRIFGPQNKMLSEPELNSAEKQEDDRFSDLTTCPSNQSHPVQTQSAISSFVNNENCNSSSSTDRGLSPLEREKNVHTELDVDNATLIGGVKQEAPEDMDYSCHLSCQNACKKSIRTILDYCDASSTPDSCKNNGEPSNNVDDANCLVGTAKNSADLGVTVRESSRIRDNRSHTKRMCHCCVDSVPSPSTIRKCRTNSGSSNGSTGNSALLPVVPLVPIKTVNSKNIVAQVKKKKKSKVLSKINTRSKLCKPRTRSTIVP